jgi:hypothetical protein
MTVRILYLDLYFFSQQHTGLSGGDDFYEWYASSSRHICFSYPYRFLGPRMVYTSGIVLDNTIEESLETLQDNKLAVVCTKLDLKPTDRYILYFTDTYLVIN